MNKILSTTQSFSCLGTQFARKLRLERDLNDIVDHGNIISGIASFCGFRNSFRFNSFISHFIIQFQVSYRQIITYKKIVKNLNKKQNFYKEYRSTKEKKRIGREREEGERWREKTERKESKIHVKDKYNIILNEDKST